LTIEDGDGSIINELFIGRRQSSSNFFTTQSDDSYLPCSFPRPWAGQIDQSLLVSAYVVFLHLVEPSGISSASRWEKMGDITPESEVLV